MAVPGQPAQFVLRLLPGLLHAVDRVAGTSRAARPDQSRAPGDDGLALSAAAAGRVPALATAVIGHYSRNPLAALLYGLVVGALLLCRSAIQSQSLRGDLLLPSADRRQARTDATVSWIVVGYWILAVALVWWAPWEEILWYLTPVAAFAAARIMRRRAEAAQAGAERADAQ